MTNEPSGVGLIVAERKRQINEEGYSLRHDQEHDEDELALAAAVYALPDRVRGIQVWQRDLWQLLWPKHWVPRLKKTDRIRELTKAGALIAAEIDRLSHD